VFGGYFDKEFKEPSRLFIKSLQKRKFSLLVSPILKAELLEAPEKVQKLLKVIPQEIILSIEISSESKRLRDQYLAEKIVNEKHMNDAHHIALAAVNDADIIVSWNFRHIVHYEKIRAFNAVNLREGYHVLDIYSPREVV